MSKNGNGEGTIYPVYDKDSGKIKYWRGQFNAGRKIDGSLNRKSVSGKTRKEVADKLHESIAKVNNNSFIEKDGTTLLELVSMNNDNKFRANLIKETTYFRNLQVNLNIKDLKLSNIPIQNITIKQINFELSSLINKYSDSVINKIIQSISAAFDTAIIMNIVDKNPFRIKGAIIKPKSNKNVKKVEAFTIEEQKLFLAELEKNYDSYTDLFYIAIYTGMRVGEILALTKNDIDFNKNTILINKTITKDLNGKCIVGEVTKTEAGTRVIPIPSKIRNILLVSCLKTKNYLFFNNDRNINPTTINTHFKKICKNAGIYTKTKQINMKGRKNLVNLSTSTANTHMLRHTYATRCIEAGMTANVLQKLLGHTDISTTLNTYTSVFNKFKEDELNKVEQYLNALNM